MTGASVAGTSCGASVAGTRLQLCPLGSWHRTNGKRACRRRRGHLGFEVLELSGSHGIGTRDLSFQPFIIALQLPEHLLQLEHLLHMNGLDGSFLWTGTGTG